MTVEFVGPFEHHDVVVDGWIVPLLTATPIHGGRVDLALDRRYALDVSLQEADRFVPFLADAIAVALGFSCHPRHGWQGPKPAMALRPRRSIALDMRDG